MSKNFVFTWFDTSLGLLTDESPSPWTPPETVSFAQYSVERCSTTGRVHLQGFVCYKKRTRITTVKKDLPTGAHLEVMRGPVSASIEYTSKPETHVAGPWRFGTAPRDNGDTKKTKWEALQADVKAGMCERDLYEKYPSFLDRSRGVDKCISLYAPRIPDRPVDVYILWGPASAGKSYRCKQAFPDYFEAHGDLGLRTFLSYRGEKTVIIDAFLSIAWPMTSLESMIKDAVCDIPVMYGSVKTLWTTFIITTNQHPDSMYTGAVNRDALFTRVKHIYHITAREDRGGEHIDFSI